MSDEIEVPQALELAAEPAAPPKKIRKPRAKKSTEPKPPKVKKPPKPKKVKPARDIRTVFRSRLKEITVEKIKKPWMAAKAFRLVDNAHDLEAWVDMVLADKSRHHSWAGVTSPVVAVDTETTSLDTRILMDIQEQPDGSWEATYEVMVEIAGVCLSVDGIEGLYVPIFHEKGNNVPRAEASRILQKLFDQSHLVFYNAKFDREILRLCLGLYLRPYPHFEDVQVLKYINDPKADLGDKGAYSGAATGLKGLSKTVLGIEQIELDELTKVRAHKLNSETGKNTMKDQLVPFTWVPTNLALWYAAGDAICTWLLWDGMKELARSRKLVHRIDHELVDSLTYVERQRFKIDVNRQRRTSRWHARKLEDLEIRLKALAIEGGWPDNPEKPFNPGSPKQLGELLFGKMGFKPYRTTDEGNVSTDKETLTELQKEFPDNVFLKTLKKFRDYAALHPENLKFDPRDHSARMYLKQNVVGGGRLSGAGGDFEADGGFELNPQGVKKLEPDMQWRVYGNVLDPDEVPADQIDAYTEDDLHPSCFKMEEINVEVEIEPTEESSFINSWLTLSPELQKLAIEKAHERMKASIDRGLVETRNSAGRSIDKELQGTGPECLLYQVLQATVDPILYPKLHASLQGWQPGVNTFHKSGDVAFAEVKSTPYFSGRLNNLGLVGWEEQGKLLERIEETEQENKTEEANELRLKAKAQFRPHVLVIGEFPRYRIAGWIIGVDGQKQEHKTNFKKDDRPWVYAPEQRALNTSLDALMREMEIHCGGTAPKKTKKQKVRKKAPGIINNHIGMYQGYAICLVPKCQSCRERFGVLIENTSMDANETVNLRCLFVAEDGWTFFSIDYSNIEVRAAANLSGETELQKIFLHGDGDHHALTASKVFPGYDDPNSADYKAKSLRALAKIINFALQYGGTEYTIYESMSKKDPTITREKCAEMVANYWKGVPKFAEWCGMKRGRARNELLCETATGRIINFKSAMDAKRIRKPNEIERKNLSKYYDFRREAKRAKEEDDPDKEARYMDAADGMWKNPDTGVRNAIEYNKFLGKIERVSVNAPVQGIAGDFMRIALNRIRQWVMSDPDIQSVFRLHGSVHDEIDISIKNEYVPFVLPRLTRWMKLRKYHENMEWPVPIECDAEYGRSWDIDFNVTDKKHPDAFTRIRGLETYIPSDFDVASVRNLFKAMLSGNEQKIARVKAWMQQNLHPRAFACSNGLFKATDPKDIKQQLIAVFQLHEYWIIDHTPDDNSNSLEKLAGYEARMEFDPKKTRGKVPSFGYLGAIPLDARLKRPELAILGEEPIPVPPRETEEPQIELPLVVEEEITPEVLIPIVEEVLVAALGSETPGKPIYVIKATIRPGSQDAYRLQAALGKGKGDKSLFMEFEGRIDLIDQLVTDQVPEEFVAEVRYASA